MTKHQDRAAQTTEMYCLTVWRLDQGHGALRVSSSEASPLGLLTAASSFSMILPVSVCVCPNLPLLSGQQSYCLRAHPKDLI